MSERSLVRIAELQHTLKSAIGCVGVGVHSGARVAMTLKPGPVNSGVVFVRTDRPAHEAEIPARWDTVSDTRLCTAISNDDSVSVGTIEHLMAALRGCGIDNAVIELDGPEVPVMDGSAEPFVFLIECAGIVAQNAPRRSIKILREVTYAEGDKSVTLSPSSNSTFSLEIDFASSAVSRQEGFFWLTENRFKTEISRARTFGFLHEIEYLRSVGLARGGSLDNAIVVSDDRVMNDGGLRYPNEFVRHKILDSVGDLYLAGAPIIGHFEGVRSGHAMNNRLLHVLFAQPNAWMWQDSVDVEPLQTMQKIAVHA